MGLHHNPTGDIEGVTAKGFYAAALKPEDGYAPWGGRVVSQRSMVFPALAAAVLVLTTVFSNNTLSL